jgi:hypothetical protein
MNITTMKTILMEMTPAQAADLLKRNTGNRRFRPRHALRLRRMIEGGRWKVTHQGIALAPDGRVLDGQHRLAAIRDSGTTVWLNVSFDVPEDAFEVMDGVLAPRSLGDRARMSAHHVALARLAHTVMTGERKMLVDTVSEITPVWRMLVPFSDALDSATHKRVKNRSSASMRLAACARMAQGHKPYVTGLYKAFVELNVTSLPPVAVSMLRQLDDGTTSARRDPYMLLAKAWTMFDPARANVAKITIKDPDNNLREIAAVLRLAGAA